MITYLVNALLQPKYSSINSNLSSSSSATMFLDTNYTCCNVVNQYSIGDSQSVIPYVAKKTNDKKCKKLHINKYYSSTTRNLNKKSKIVANIYADTYKQNNVKFIKNKKLSYTGNIPQIPKVLYESLINLINLIHIKMSIEQLSTNITNAIELEKQAIQNNIAILNNTIIQTAKELTKAINSIRPAQNYGLPQSMNLSKVCIKGDSGNMNIEVEGSDKEIVKKEIEKEMNMIKESFWTSKFLNPNTYCKKCQQLRHKDNTCKFLCSICNGDHQSNTCTHKLHCRWCGQKKGEHKCEAFEHIYRTKIKCPICKLKGHFGNECNLLFLALSTYWRRNNNTNRRRRRFTNRLGANLRRNKRRIAIRAK
jgi:hypothetical protein